MNMIQDLIDIWVDWSTNHGVTYEMSNGLKGVVPTIFDLLRLLEELGIKNFRIISETTFENFRTGRRQKIIDLVHAKGGEWWVIPNIRTPRMYQVLGLSTRKKTIHGVEEKSDKSDANDVKAIREYALANPGHLKKATVETDEAKIERRVRVSNELTTLRKTPAILEDGEEVDEKYLFAQEVIALLPDPEELTEVQKKVLLSKTDRTYRAPMLAAIGLATRHTSSRKEFTAALGFHDHGYPCQARSDMYHHSFKHILKGYPEVTKGDIQREVRWVRRQLVGKI
jgi:hypothetical protein